MNELVRIEAPAPRRPFDEVMRMADAFAKSNMFGVKNVEQALALMMMAEAEGKHVATAMQDYDVIQGRPALKADAMLGRFQLAGGHVKWTTETDECYAGIFSHPSCDPHEISWDMDRAKQAQLGGKENYRKFPRQMLRARVIAEGVRSTYPACLRGAPHYVSEEVQDFDEVSTPSVPALPHEPDAGPSDAPPKTQQATGAGNPPSAPVATMSKADSRADFKALDYEMRACTTSAELLAWGKLNLKRIQLQDPSFQGDLRKNMRELLDGLRHLERAADDANEEFEGARP